jgi:hypothetical protein
LHSGVKLLAIIGYDRAFCTLSRFELAQQCGECTCYFRRCSSCGSFGCGRVGAALPLLFSGRGGCSLGSGGRKSLLDGFRGEVFRKGTAHGGRTLGRRIDERSRAKQRVRKSRRIRCISKRAHWL